MKFSCSTTWLLQRALLFNCLAFGLMLCAPTLISALPGDLDLTFSAGGIAITNIRRADVASAMVVQTDGKIVLAGSSDISGSFNRDFTLARYNADGSLDGSFGTGGAVITTVSNMDDAAFAVAIQADGKIVAAGISSEADNLQRVAVARYGTDGSLDNSFGVGRIVKTLVNNSSALASGMVIQPDGKIVVAGTVNGSFLVLRYDTNGSLDSTFGDNGIVVTIIPNVFMATAHDAAIHSDGKIVVVGASRLFLSPIVFDFTLVRYNPDGTRDFTFDGDGIVVSPVGRSHANAVAIQADGKIVAAGISRASSTSTNSFGLVRLIPNGSLDSTFGSGGTIITDINNLHDSPEAVAIQPDGKILAAGFNGNFTVNNDFVVVRYHGDAPARGSHFDFDGDNKTDLGIFRPSVGEWWLNRSSINSTVTIRFGNSTDKITPADYTGDGKTDIAFFRPSTNQWFVLRSEDLSFFAFPFGASGDVPVPADYDGDGRADAAVFRPSNSTWYVQRSTAGTLIQQFGIAGDLPTPNAFVP